MLNAGVLTFKEFAMREPLPLSTIHEAVLEFLRGRDDAVVFGATAVNAYVAGRRMSKPNLTRMPVGTAFHERTAALCESLNYREWSGYYAVSAYEAHHEHEYNAIRNASALIDVSPLFKYRLSGRDAA